MKPKERTFYEDSLKDYWDLKSSMETYFKEGKAEGIAEGKKEQNIEIAKSALKNGLDVALIQKLTGLSKDEIEQLK
ncbi:MAG TPA: hypothetical protein PKA00_06085 [Saprospiraceae bacterium]|nr:hypothetical protein [Saprospiraceae bacterium]HMQ82453.1 hypothetical protein [Saprospiraceae bacterium]